ncbi:hypothetical protein KP509_38G024300 [Ceratopteris richardii]|uniref:Uncharacterized protein n=1 Tax=Ceratopteris richardii TaxID=49495 RepID=A0A8T2Q358_CERRI|nr:hypothetical protein KP509_38G024300 [Ceratopteris richardii]
MVVGRMELQKKEGRRKESLCELAPSAGTPPSLSIIVGVVGRQTNLHIMVRFLPHFLRNTVPFRLSNRAPGRPHHRHHQKDGGRIATRRVTDGRNSERRAVASVRRTSDDRKKEGGHGRDPERGMMREEGGRVRMQQREDRGVGDAGWRSRFLVCDLRTPNLQSDAGGEER